MDLVDRFGRVPRDLRISVTERCNFRCTYCLPEEEHLHGGRPPLLSFEEIDRLARLFAERGIRKFRLTGGEPLLRKNLPDLVAKLSSMAGIEDLALTTNGFFLAEVARDLAGAGLKRVSVSLDSLQPDVFARLTGRRALNRVLQGLDAARAAGFSPIKLNTVLIRGENDGEILNLVDFARETGCPIRFIEFMPLDSGREWTRDRVVPTDFILEAISARFPLVPVIPRTASETARCFAFEDGKGEVGFIASVTRPFCAHCNRLRLTADGRLRTCLFAHTEIDLCTPLRRSAPDEEIHALIVNGVYGKEWGHRIAEPDFLPPQRGMVRIGG
ncbi:MAG: GTP 3',8-cyclase MoaA [Nitrospirae bacterium]|nr:GTP 3',8-cyclase MoaA [Nitrospirota bacterium]